MLKKIIVLFFISGRSQDDSEENPVQVNTEMFPYIFKV